MSKLIAVPLKKPSEVDVIKPLTNLIKSAYCNSNCSVNYNDAIMEFSNQRNIAIWKFFEKNENSLAIVYSYFDQLCLLETKIPIQELQIPFKWKDAFDKGSIFGGRISLTHSSLAYEKVCVLFNIASLQSYVGASQGFDSDEHLKLSAKLFQLSAGIFRHLKNLIPAVISTEPTPDLNPETLSALSLLMVAQAQEIIIMKAVKDNLKEIIIAKLCCQAEELYSEVLRTMQKENLKNLWEKEWTVIVAGKQYGFHAMFQFYQSLVCRIEKKIGEEIAHLQESIEYFKLAQSRSFCSNLFEEYANRAQKNLSETRKDNDFIYNEIIPDVKSLPSPGKALLVKPIPVSGKMNPNSKDIFVELVPVVLHQAMLASEIRKNEIVNAEIMKLREATQSLNGILAKLNLPAAVENVDASGLPPSLLEKSNNLKQKGGITSIRTIITELPELLTRNREILDETERLLDEERDSDNQLRYQFKEKWTRIPSDKLTEMFRSNAKKYRALINNAIQADMVVRQKFEKHVKGIELLSKTTDEINESIPLANGKVDTKSDSVQKLKSLMQNVENIKTERDAIESDLKSATINLKEQFLKALSQDGAINEPSLSIAEIGKTVLPLQSQIEESIKKQKMLIDDIETSNKTFISESGSVDGFRSSLFSELAASYDSFIELQNNLREGTKFYSDLTQLLLVFQNKISDYCFARKTEKEELLKDLTAESSRQQSESLPSLPSHYNSAKLDSELLIPTGTFPYPTQIHGMPLPYGVNANAPYATYVAPPMPQGYNPYATLPYPNTSYYSGFPQGPHPTSNYGTYPGSYVSEKDKYQNKQETR